MSHRLLSQSAVLFCCLTLGFAGCGGDESTEVAQAPASPAPAAPAAASSGGESEGGGESYGGESYGGESYGGESSGSGDSGESGGGYNGGYSGGYDGGDGEGEEMGGYDGGYDGGYGGEGEGDEMGGYDGGYGGGGPGMASSGGGYGDEGDEGYGGGYNGGYGGEGGPGMGAPGLGGPGMGAPGMGGPGMGMGGMGNQPPAMTFAKVNQFMLQNCSMCHMRGQTKGDINLAAVTSDVSDSADLWESVASALESGSMPPANRRQPPPQQKQAVADWIQAQLSEAEEAMKDLLTTSKRKFGNGKEDEGIQLLYAHLASAPSETVKEQLSQVGFYMRGRRPVTALRFAAAVVIDVPETLTDVKPIGSSQFGGAGGGGYGGGGYGEGYGSPRGGETKGRTFESLTGELGQRVVSEFTNRWTEGKFGSLFSDATAAVAESAAPAAGGYGGGMYGGGGYGDEGDEGYGGGGPGMGAPALGGPGLGAPGLGAPGLGDPGMGAPGLGDPGMGAGMGMGAPNRAAPKTNTLAGQSLAVGMTYLGDGSRKEIEEKFAESGADILFLFDVDVKSNARTRIVTNKTTVRVLDSAGETVGASRQLVNTDVEKNRLREKDDGLETNIERLFGLVDREVSVIPMPNSMQASHAQSRMAAILSDGSVTPLRKMFEARLYHSMGLLTAEELSMAYQIVMEGNEGESLALGSDEDRQFVIQNALESLTAL